jgi:hypothetical protein
MVEHVEMTFGDDALMMRPADHPLRRWMATASVRASTLRRRCRALHPSADRRLPGVVLPEGTD